MENRVIKSTPLNSTVSLYGIAEAELQPLRGGHFAQVYGFKRNDKNFVLRLSPPNEDVDLPAQKSILAWMAYLAAHGASVPEPLPSQNGNLVEVISSPEGEWLAVAFTQAEGILSEEIPLDQWDDVQFQTLGRSIGKIHALARGYVPSNEVSFPQWETGGNLFNRQIENEHWLKKRQTQLLEKIHALPKSADAYGLVHCDLHFGNFFVDVRKQIVTLIDFDDCAYSWFVMDIAVLLFDILVLYPGTEKDEYGQGFLRSFLTGYLTENSLPMFWLEQLPLFLKLLEINIYDMVAKSYPDNADEWVMKFMPGRKERLENDTPYMSLNYSALNLAYAPQESI
jgi:Ser/Thr protein kinase RdoA (MazF antagonist)